MPFVRGPVKGGKKLKLYSPFLEQRCLLLGSFFWSQRQAVFLEALVLYISACTDMRIYI